MSKIRAQAITTEHDLKMTTILYQNDVASFSRFMPSPHDYGYLKRVDFLLYLTLKLEFSSRVQERRKDMFYLTTHSTHCIYGYMASDIWLRTTQIAREETRCRHMSYTFRLAARVLLYSPSHRQDNTYHGLCYTSRGALAGTRNSSMDPPHEGSIRRPIAP